MLEYLCKRSIKPFVELSLVIVGCIVGNVGGAFWKGIRTCGIKAISLVIVDNVSNSVTGVDPFPKLAYITHSAI